MRALAAPPKLPGGPYVMGVVNVTPDSFSDGGRYGDDAARAADAGAALLDAGADIIDVGGESTRPGAAPVDLAEERRRVLPVVSALARLGAPVSIDTMKPAVARAAIEAGAIVWNDVNALQAPEAVETAAALGCGVVVMHMQGSPATMQAAPRYRDVVSDVADALRGRLRVLAAAGVHDVWIDPGIGFGKTLEQNIALLRALPALRALAPVLVGASRKSFIGRIESRDGAPVSHEGARLGGSVAAAVFAARRGAAMVRVHDVAETVQALRVARALEEGSS
ncbi:MAG: dihydropteroate synthase [Hyphomonadaceae bacterium]|nr:dihydropteroate synthase [Hyphomonadaceae bacterium]